MKTEKLSLKAIKNVLSRAEMRKIMAGGSGGGTCGDKCQLEEPTGCAGNQSCGIIECETGDGKVMQAVCQ